MSSNRRRSVSVNVRLVAAGTRVVLLRGAAPFPAGVVSDVRIEGHLKPYVVTCDSGEVAYASAYDIALEEDAAATPLGMRPEY